MPVKHTVVHEEDQDTVRRAAEAALVNYRERYPSFQPDAVWTTPEHGEISFKVKGMTMRAHIDMRPGAIDVSIEVPLVFRMFKDCAVKAVDAEVRKWLAQVKRESA